MKKYYLLFGIVTISILLLGSVPILVVAQDDFMSEPPWPGTYDVKFNVTLTNVWSSGDPNLSTPFGETNTNLRYNVTEFASPLDQYINMGFFPTGESEDSTVPEIAINGTLVNSTLFIKINNDQGTQIDWQPSLILGDDIIFSWQLEEEPVDPPFPGFDLIPEDFTIVKGSGIPAGPAITSTTNFSDFFNYLDLVKDYGYDGLPFFMPGIIYLDNLDDTYAFWTNEVNLTAMFPQPSDPSEYLDVSKAPFENTTHVGVALILEGGNSTAGTVYGNATVAFIWDRATGYLDAFAAEAFGDLDQNGTLDAGERFFIMLEQYSATQEDIPVSVGDSGEYILDLDIQYALNLENDTLETLINSRITPILDPINELDGIHLLNYTINSIDGLYYHIDGYIFDLPRFFEDRLGNLFGGGSITGIGAQTTLPIESYYTSIEQLSGGQGENTHSWAINLFDAAVYQNMTEWLEGNRDYSTEYIGWNGTHNVFNTSHLKLSNKPGVEQVWLFNQTTWDNSWNKNTTTFEEHFNNMVISGAEYVGPPVYEDNGNLWVIGPNGTVEGYNHDSFPDSTNWATPYYAVYLIKGMPETSYTSYMPMTNLLMMPFMLTGGMGSQTEPAPEEGIGASMGAVVPMPIRTPDWDVTGGMYVFLEGVMDQLEAVIEDPAFIDFIETLPLEEAGIPTGDSIKIKNVDINYDWIDEVQGFGYVGLESSENLDIEVFDNNTEDKKTDFMHLQFGSQAEYTWETNGSLDRVMLYFDLYLNYTSVPWPEPILPTTTTTTTEPELSPGFEAFLTIGTLVLLPLVYKKKRR